DVGSWARWAARRPPMVPQPMTQTRSGCVAFAPGDDRVAQDAHGLDLGLDRVAVWGKCTHALGPLGVGRLTPTWRGKVHAHLRERCCARSFPSQRSVSTPSESRAASGAVAAAATVSTGAG